MLHMNLIRQPSLILTNASELRSATGHQAQATGRGRLVDHINTQFVDPVFQGPEDRLRMIHMIDIQRKETRRKGILVASFLAVESSLPADSRQVTFTVEMASGNLITQGTYPRRTDELLEQFPRDRVRVRGTVVTIIKSHT